MSVKKVKKLINDRFEIKNGLVGVNRDVMFQLIELIYFKSDEILQNLIGMSGECILWLNHPHYSFCRKAPKLNLKKLTIPNYHLQLGEKKLVINPTSIVFKLNGIWDQGSVFLNLFVKKMILECTVKIEFETKQGIYIGISTPSQLKKAMKSHIGWSDCGASLHFSYYSYIMCNGKCSYDLKEGGITKGESVIAIIDQRNNNSLKSEGKMNFIKSGKKVSHTIINIPSSGVHLGFSGTNSFFTLHITSLRKFYVPSAATGGVDMTRCVAYDFNGEFKNHSYNHLDENGEEILNIKEFYHLFEKK